MRRQCSTLKYNREIRVSYDVEVVEEKRTYRSGV